MTKATLIGSRDYTLRAPPVVKGQAQKYIDESLFVCRVRVVGETQEPLRVTLKTKRRRRHTRHLWSKHKYTVLRVTQLQVVEQGDAPILDAAIDGGDGQVIEQVQ